MILKDYKLSVIIINFKVIHISYISKGIYLDKSSKIKSTKIKTHGEKRGGITNTLS